MSSEEAGNRGPSNELAVDIERSAGSACDGDPNQDSSGSEDEARDVMFLALRSQIREALRDEHQLELAKVKQMYEAELRELRADIATMQQVQAEQQDWKQVGI